MLGRRFSVSTLALSLAGVAAITALFTRVIPVNASTVGYLYLVLVLGTATLSGFREAAVTSVAAMLCYNFFFLPPVGRLVIADPQNWAALFAFLVTALVASHLSDRAQKQAAEARRRQKETEQLYALSRAILLTNTSRPIGAQTAQLIAQVFDSPAVVILDAKSGGIYEGGASEISNVDALMKQAVMQGSHHHDAERRLDVWPIALGGHPIGALCATGIQISDGAVQALLNLVAIALERVRTEEAANRAEAARQSEEFKSTLLDAIAHEFKTPLTSIKAASTSLLAGPQELRPEQVELATVIDEETDRLSLLVTEAVKMAEIDAGKVKLEREAVEAEALVDAAAAGFTARGENRLQKLCEKDGRTKVLADRELVTLALRHLIDNALKYSPPGSPVRVVTSAELVRLVIRVIDQGPGIPERDREWIFDKYHRRSSSRDAVPGTGLGLHIAREIARTHGGDLWMQPAEGGGSEFCLALPVARDQ